MTDSDDQLRHLLDCGYELAASHLEGINEAALELADAAGDDRRVMERVSRRRRTSAPRPKPCQQPGGFADPSRHRVGHVAVGLGQHPAGAVTRVLGLRGSSSQHPPSPEGFLVTGGSALVFCDGHRRSRG